MFSSALATLDFSSTRATLGPSPVRLLLPFGNWLSNNGNPLRMPPQSCCALERATSIVLDTGSSLEMATAVKPATKLFIIEHKEYV